MFPFIRLAAELMRSRKMPRLTDPTAVHESYHRIMPWDLDMFLELNNGRALTLFDIGRMGLAMRIGLIDAIRKNGWQLTMGGSFVRYRRRVRNFEKVRVTSRAICNDGKFTYIEQAMWKMDGECAHHALYRAVVTDKNGSVHTDKVLAAMGHPGVNPQMPAWIEAWVKSEETRPWPPMQDLDQTLKVKAAAH